MLLKIKHCFIGVLMLSSCALYHPAYFGTNYDPTTNVDAYYAVSDIKRPFKVIGHMNAVTGRSEGIQERTRKAVINKAKQVGADAVVFSELTRQSHTNATDDLYMKVDVIKFEH